MKFFEFRMIAANGGAIGFIVDADDIFAAVQEGIKVCRFDGAVSIQVIEISQATGRKAGESVTGGAIAGAGELQGQVSAPFAIAAGPERPVLNKAGGEPTRAHAADCAILKGWPHRCTCVGYALSHNGK